jgi:hypothetical protein
MKYLEFGVSVISLGWWIGEGHKVRQSTLGSRLSDLSHKEDISF